jgi:hypothetical protein
MHVVVGMAPLMKQLCSFILLSPCTLFWTSLQEISSILKISFQDIKHVPKTQLLPHVAIKTNLHQSIVVIKGCTLINTSYTIVEGKEMYFTQIKTAFKIRNTYEFGHKHTVINNIFTR